MASYSVDMSKEFVAVLTVEAMKGKCTDGEVIRRAVAIYVCLQNQIRTCGFRVALIDKDDKIVKSIELP